MKQEMNCQYCGKQNPDMSCVLIGAPTPDCPFSLSAAQPGKMICLNCYEAAKLKKGA